jgi:hypothetical protein
MLLRELEFTQLFVILISNKQNILCISVLYFTLHMFGLMMTDLKMSKSSLIKHLKT